MANGLYLWLKSQHNAQQRQRQKELPASEDAVYHDASEPAPDLAEKLDRAMDRETARQALDIARARAQASLEADGKSVHWQVFARRFDREPFKDIAEQLSLADTETAKTMDRTARARVVRELRKIVVRDQGGQGVDKILQSYLESFQS